ncbi:predicted protein [Verticillium alfalfae VaMs.102]|uniref:Predicted protein n=1 Tax=Verticillium alfalfae (strain VaMs.102 / ATCC MYA-4576 / FGSC 10136) TaxID=526221 RepID=C9SXI0_VERA1|nr:predicted protein [Verticillium alfalfae VaMs.102]EEY23370.1 predicted protein [Verticillium alfalfae VaMs.102]
MVCEGTRTGRWSGPKFVVGRPSLLVVEGVSVSFVWWPGEREALGGGLELGWRRPRTQRRRTKASRDAEEREWQGQRARQGRVSRVEPREASYTRQTASGSGQAQRTSAKVPSHVRSVRGDLAVWAGQEEVCFRVTSLGGVALVESDPKSENNVNVSRLPQLRCLCDALRAIPTLRCGTSSDRRWGLVR